MVPVMGDVGRQILAWRNKSSLMHLHSVEEFKTEADKRAHELICKCLNNLFPDVEILSEESSVPQGERPDVYWLVDPIDGTASWYHGFDGFVTQAAYIERGLPMFGIIHAPVLNKTWSAFRGSGAYLNGQHLPRLKAGKRLLVTDNTPEPHGIAKLLIEHLNATGYMESGSLGLKSVLVAEGTVDLFVKNVVVRDWDIAPAEVILHEVGGLLCLPDGSPYIFNGEFEKHKGFIVARDVELMKKTVCFFTKNRNHDTSQPKNSLFCK
jgi:fructose-1,6-bisphosphatase/inositol monophosphatase family enzyme